MTSPLRNLSVHVDSGDALDIRRFAVQERISSLFEITITALSENADIDFDAIVGQPASFRMYTGVPGPVPFRFWTGICKHIQQVAAEDTGLSTYELTIVPTLWFATQRRNHRMFQQISELDIVCKLLGEWGIRPELRITSAYKKRKYRVQYAESDFAFMSRMLEDVGISYYFEQEESETKLVLADAPQSREPRADRISFRDHPTEMDREYVTKVRIGQRVRPGRYTVRDHDARLAPTYKLLASAEAPNAGVEGRLESFHYVPGAFLFGTEQGEDTPFADDKGKTRTDEKEGGAVVKKRLEAKRASAKVCSFETNAIDLAPGVVMSILDHPRSDLAGGNSLLVLEATHSGTWNGDWTHGCEVGRADIAFRPPLSTPKPKISGVESATVVGSPGEEIHTDEFGRVRVHFHWDRESGMNDNSSCWIHVSQPWGGTGYGGTNLPRVGQEVLVDFLGGDPDRPIITGRVYTNLQKTPYKLPDNKTQSGWKSKSSPQTGGYNEIMFEDLAGKELVRMQAEKDLHKLVKNDEQVTIGHDRTKRVKNDDKLTVDNDRTKLVKNNEDVTIGHDRTKLVENDERVTIGNDRTKMVMNDEESTIGRDRTKLVKNDETVTIGNDRTKVVKNDENVTIGNDRTKLVTNDENVTIGNDRTKLVQNNEFATIGKDLIQTVMENVREITGMSRNIVVGVNRATQVGMIDSTMVGDVHSVMISPPGEEWSTETQTHQTMTDNKIELGTTGGATITLEGAKITLRADEILITGSKGITLESADEEIKLEAGKTISAKGKKGITLESADEEIKLEAGEKISATGKKGVVLEVEAGGGDMLIKGGPTVKINC